MALFLLHFVIKANISLLAENTEQEQSVNEVLLPKDNGSLRLAMRPATAIAHVRLLTYFCAACSVH